MQSESPKQPASSASSSSPVTPSTGRLSGHSMKRSSSNLDRSQTSDGEHSKSRESVSEVSLSPKGRSPSPTKIEAQESKISSINNKNCKQKVLVGISLVLLVSLTPSLFSLTAFAAFGPALHVPHPPECQNPHTVDKRAKEGSQKGTDNFTEVKGKQKYMLHF